MIDFVTDINSLSLFCDRYWWSNFISWQTLMFWLIFWQILVVWLIFWSLVNGLYVPRKLYILFQIHRLQMFNCNVCAKSFPRPDKLKLHQLRHSAHREYMCDMCGRQFKRKDKLREHTKRVHDCKEGDDSSLLLNEGNGIALSKPSQKINSIAYANKVGSVVFSILQWNGSILVLIFEES